MIPSVAEILLVDDNPADLELTMEALKQSKWPTHVSSVCDGAEAIAFLHRKGKFDSVTRPNLVLLDLNLPKKDGRAVLAELKADPELRRIPVVMFSTSQAPVDVESCYGLGANSYVSKPTTLAGWIAAVKTVNEFWVGCAWLPREENE
jgi:chemotaxis family two-component system response regulator Rcp1